MAKQEHATANVPIEPKHEVITLTREQLRTIIEEARAPAPPPAPSIEEAFEAHQRMMADARNRVVRSWYVAFVSRATKASGVAFVTASRRHASGRVINLAEYRYPDGSDRSVANGGLCALAEIVDTHGQLTPMFRQWRYSTFWKEDLRAFAGEDASKLDAIGPPRPTLEDALLDLDGYTPPALTDEPRVPEIIPRAREAVAP